MKQMSLALVFASLVGLGGCAAKQSFPATVHTTSAIPPEQMANAPSCMGVREHVASKSFFADRSIVGIERVQQKQFVGARNFVYRPAGVEISLAADHGHHEQFLDRLARCHVDTYAQSGYSPGDDPLSVPGAQVDIRPTKGGYAVRITSDDWDAAREILARAERIPR